MGFDRPTRTVDYVDLKRETERGERRLAFRILQFLPQEVGNFKNPTTGEKTKVWPVLADCKILDGPNAGVVFRGKTYKFGITNALRDASPEEEPKTHVGQQLMVVAARPTGKNVSPDSVFGNRPDDDVYAEMCEQFDRLGGWDRSIRPADLVASNGSGAQAAPEGGTRRPMPSTPDTPPEARQSSGGGPVRPFGRRPMAQPAGQGT